MNNKNDNKIDISSDDWGAVINCAVRYALGRRTYMPGLIIDTISPYLGCVSNKTLWCLERDLEEAGRLPDGYGDEAFVTAVVTYEDFEIHKKYDLIIYPKEKTPYEKQTRALVESVMEMQEETKNEDYLQLPLSINNKNIIWKETEKPIFAVVFFISFILLIGSWIGVDNDLAKENKKREQALKLEYSEFVSKLELLISSYTSLVLFERCQ